jgi:hypothetical protein
VTELASYVIGVLTGAGIVWMTGILIWRAVSDE